MATGRPAHEGPDTSLAGPSTALVLHLHRPPLIRALVSRRFLPLNPDRRSPPSFRRRSPIADRRSSPELELEPELPRPTGDSADEIETWGGGFLDRACFRLGF
ncbi:hypothetical protein NL676_009211 [Syzygium grande]|nr:hypothetical protein NL676_009211 [Syzygium grande]